MQPAPPDIVDTRTREPKGKPPERCDACGAQAWMLVDLHPGNLAFCGHHGTKYLPKLLEAGADIDDRREEIEP